MAKAGMSTTGAENTRFSRRRGCNLNGISKNAMSTYGADRRCL